VCTTESLGIVASMMCLEIDQTARLMFVQRQLGQFCDYKTVELRHQVRTIHACCSCATATRPIWR
jgi:hypothetical protein